jgi:translation initiation factor IF-2
VESYGNRLKDVGPSIPVQVAGFSVLPEAGDYFEVVSMSEQQQRIKQMNEVGVAVPAKRSSEGVINLLIKTDSNSSKEALTGAIEKLSKASEKGFNIVSAGIGAVTESDVMLAANTKSTIWGLHVKVEPNAQTLAQREAVKITLHGIIYKLLEALEEVALGAREIKMIRTKIGEAVVRKVFDIKGLGVIAGSYVKDGRFSREGTVVIFRGNKKVGEGKIKSLQRDKKVVKEVHSGFECGFMIDGFNEWEIDDRVECYVDIPEVLKSK